MDILATIAIVVAVGLGGWLFAVRRDARRLASELSAAKADGERRLQEEREQHQAEQQRQEEAHNADRERLAVAHREEQQRQQEAHQAEMKRLQESHQQQMGMFRGEMENATRNILEKQSERLKDKNTEQIDTILTPLREQLRTMHDAIEKNKESRTRDASALREAMQLFAQKSERQDEITRNLTEALKNKGKVQGDWGEQVLEQILQASGLRAGQDYEVQENVKDEEGNNLRPDVVVHCPDGTSVIIDSKVSLTAYADYIGATSDEEREAAAKENLVSVNRHITELANKSYRKLVKDAAPTVLMFIPNEGSYILAFEKDNGIGLKAYNKGVVLINPTNLMLALHLIDQMWKNEDRDRNVQEILKNAAGIYDKFVTFAETFERMGAQLTTVQRSYDTAIGQLRDGKGNIIHRLEELTKRGVAASKKIPAEFVQINNE